MTDSKRPEMVCATCGGRLIRDFGGWGHARKPERRHVVKPVEETPECEIVIGGMLTSKCGAPTHGMTMPDANGRTIDVCDYHFVLCNPAEDETRTR